MLPTPDHYLQRRAGLSTKTRSGVHFIVDWLGWLCYLSTLRSNMAHAQIASIRITTSGNKFSSWNVLSAITLYPHEAGKIFPTISNAFGSPEKSFLPFQMLLAAIQSET